MPEMWAPPPRRGLSATGAARCFCSEQHQLTPGSLRERERPSPGHVFSDVRLLWACTARQWHCPRVAAEHLKCGECSCGAEL